MESKLRPVEVKEKNVVVRVKNGENVPERLRGKEGVLWEVAQSGRKLAVVEINGMIERIPREELETV